MSRVTRLLSSGTRNSYDYLQICSRSDPQYYAMENKRAPETALIAEDFYVVEVDGTRQDTPSVV